jgi:hypothetical protein
MDPITLAVVSALAGGVTSSVTKVAAEQALVDAYQKLKSLLAGRLGRDSGVVQAINDLETKPDSKARRDVLEEEVVAAQIERDTNLAQAVAAILDRMESQHLLQQSNQTATGSYIAQASGGSTAAISTSGPDCAKPV